MTYTQLCLVMVPASVLLERIRAERAARPRPARGRRRQIAAPGRQLELPVR